VIWRQDLDDILLSHVLFVGCVIDCLFVGRVEGQVLTMLLICFVCFEVLVSCSKRA
jgi:hypothetical protein